MRAVQPVQSDFAERDGVTIHFEVYGEGSPTVYLLMPDVIVHSRAWKGQIPFLSRLCRVVVSDPPGNGLSPVPDSLDRMGTRARLDDQWAVLDAVGADRAILVGVCTGAGHALTMAAEHPERVLGVCAINPGLLLTEPLPHRIAFDFDEHRDTYVGWQKQNRNYWRQDWPDFSRFFFGEMFPEPHSSKQIEDCVAWSLGAGAETMLRENDARPYLDDEIPRARAICEAVRCPVLVINGSLDQCQNPLRSPIVADLTGGQLVVIEGGGHLPQARDPVKVNLLLRDFIRRVAP
ncbi:alpha/beta hydrolase [Microbacterium terregens]|uniref:Alpha/beta fold hydrolase n=1 Tax=Microbacterium terregens TaxID=69363 RepID=A0ABV5SWC6_9MICO